MTVKPCNKLAVGGKRSGLIEFIEVFHSFQHMTCLVGFPQVVQEQKLCEVRT